MLLNGWVFRLLWTAGNCVKMLMEWYFLCWNLICMDWQLSWNRFMWKILGASLGQIITVSHSKTVSTCTIIRTHPNLLEIMGTFTPGLDRKEMIVKRNMDIKMIMNSYHMISRGTWVHFKLWKQVGEIELFHVKYIPAIIEADIT